MSDDLIQPRVQKIALSAVAPLSRPHRIPLGKSSLPWENHESNLQGVHNHIFRQLTASAQNRFRFNPMLSQSFTDDSLISVNPYLLDRLGKVAEFTHKKANSDGERI